MATGFRAGALAAVRVPLPGEVLPPSRAAAYRGHAAGHLPALAALPDRALDGDRASHHLPDSQGPPFSCAEIEARKGLRKRFKSGLKCFRGQEVRTSPFWGPGILVDTSPFSP